VLEWL